MSRTPSPKNRAIIAAAGSRKTTHLVDEALATPHKRILITTFTNENLDQITRYFVAKHGCVPAHVTVMSWYTYLLQHWVRPYQRSLTPGTSIQAVWFGDLPLRTRRVKKSSAQSYYLTTSSLIYRDRVAEYACDVNARSGDRVIRRQERIFDVICLDEVQDVSGYDFDILDRLLASEVSILCVGDPRQATYSTNHGVKNKRFKGKNIVRWVEEKERAGALAVEQRTESFRCNQQICDFADSLYPSLPSTRSMNDTTTGHDGIIMVPRRSVLTYARDWSPVVLRHNKITHTLGLPALNIGLSKGRSYDRIMIFPTRPMMRFLTTRDPADAGDLAKFYVAVTRARFSVAFVVPDPAEPRGS